MNDLIKARNARTIYIAGPMTGIKDFNYPAFMAWEKILGDILGWKVLNPVRIGAEFGTADEINEDPKLLNAVIDAELAAVACADAIFLMGGWENSVGARGELAVALKHGLIILTHTVLTPDHYLVAR